MQFGLLSLKQCLEIQASMFHPLTLVYTYVTFLGYKSFYHFQDWWDGISLELPCFRYFLLYFNCSVHVYKQLFTHQQWSKYSTIYFLKEWKHNILSQAYQSMSEYHHSSTSVLSIKKSKLCCGPKKKNQTKKNKTKLFLVSIL